MRIWLEKYKPAAMRGTHLMLAALTWSAVGSALLFFGVRWIRRGEPGYGVILMGLAIVAGAAKSRWVLDRTARRMITRIEARGDGRCLGGFLSVRSWLLVGLMAGGGRLLRTGLLPLLIVGVLYVAIGTALLLSSRHLWRAWARIPSENQHSE